MSNLVKYLCEGEHPVEVAIRPALSAKAFKECVKRNFVNIRFADTQGGTELGFKLDGMESDLRNANFDLAEGSAKLVGYLTLDYINVRCIAAIELATLKGKGHLERVSRLAGNS